MTSTTAVVAYAPIDGKLNLKYETLTVKRQPNEHEVLVRMLASGICHSDIVVGSFPDGAAGVYPKVLGHEGSGYVEAVGPGVTVAKVGDPVLLSYTYCNDCVLCKTDHPAYCENFNAINGACMEKVWSGDSEGKDAGGKFFGQSSFAALSIVDEKSVVNMKGVVKDDDELKLFSPLGCGLMTGSGAVLNAAKAGKEDTILVTGMGAVGLGAVMGGKIAGCKAIIAVDRVASRLELAKQLGATHVYDTTRLDPSKEGNFAEAVQELVPDGRITKAFECTGAIPVMQAAFSSLAKRGTLVQIGIPVPVPSPMMQIDTQDFFNKTKRMELNFLGNSIPQDYVPQMIQWYREGKFPFDKLIKYYPAKNFETALEDMKAGTIKPVLIH